MTRSIISHPVTSHAEHEDTVLPIRISISFFVNHSATYGKEYVVPQRILTPITRRDDVRQPCPKKIRAYCAGRSGNPRKSAVFIGRSSSKRNTTGPRTATKSPIQHIIIIVGENRTFDHISPRRSRRRARAWITYPRRGILGTLFGRRLPRDDIRPQRKNLCERRVWLTLLPAFLFFAQTNLSTIAALL